MSVYLLPYYFRDWGEIAMARDRQQEKISILDCVVLRQVFRIYVTHLGLDEDQWQGYATTLIRDYTRIQEVDTQLLEWITRK
ncbi:hypothetical protein FKO01_59835 [Mesorhizobium sp. B2-3-3]|nr:hypothetical protein FKO01_59835 [Mesorhizobium sp. B2-3-3]